MEVKRTLRPGEEVLARHVWTNIRKGYPQVWPHQKQNTPVCLCAGGPYLTDHIEQIRKMQLKGAEVVTVGNAAATLLSLGVKVNGHVLLDGAERNKSFVAPLTDCRYFVASQCDPKVFDALTGHKHVYIWHACSTREDEKNLNDWYGKYKWIPIDGGSYVTLRAINVLKVLGYHNVYVFGMDSCYKDGEHHAYEQPNADQRTIFDYQVNGKKFKCAYWMIDQLDQFVECVKNHKFDGVNLAIMGEGLISTFVREVSLNGCNG